MRCIAALSLVVALSASQGFAQDQLPTIGGHRVDIYDYAEKIIQTQGLDQQYIKMINEIPYSIFRYDENTINANKLNENLNGEEPFKNQPFNITLPNLTGMIDTLVMMVGVTNTSGERIVSTAIIGNMRDKLAYYIDYNHNFDFTDDGSFLFFDNEEKASLISISAEGKDDPYEYILYDLALVPQYLATLDVRLINAPKVKTKKEPKFAVPYLNPRSRVNLELSFLTGPGDMDFSYTSQEGAIKQYSAAIDAVSRLSLSLSYAFRNLNVGASVAIDASQVGRQVYTLDDPKNIRGKQTIYNIGNWPRSRVMYGVFAEYDIRVYRNAYITPYFSLFRYAFLGSGGFAGYAGEVNEEMPYNQSFVERMGRQFGAKVKLPMSQKVMAVLNVGYTQNGFGLSESFVLESFDAGSVDVNYNTINYGVGAQFLLFNGKNQLSRTKPAEKKL